ncbi:MULTISPECIES: GNAT family N-acetyltransferase [Enterobacter]|uniref:GNAT family N-acetyltransferase n=1 Tax=Enterobacter TaxID=547 RepID=UPI001F3D9AB2|nr:GNAT family N-acetyltransferase [Enterobacter quasiroggenkampii]
MRLDLTAKPNSSDTEFIRLKLREYNQRHVECWPVQELAVFIRDDAKNITGGIVGLTWGNWFQTQLLWVEQPLRGKGFGSQLLLAAEREAKQRGCRFSIIDTFSFQALEFYLQKGYEVEMTLDDFPVNQQRYYLTKEF